MVSFSCEGCGDILTKKKLDNHRNQCHAEFTCIDCMQTFEGVSYRAHTSCISEAQKYQGALYRPEKEKKKQQNAASAPVPPPQKAYVEDADDEDTDDIQVEAPPHVPSPPTVAADADEPAKGYNVFDFLDPSQTPNISKTDLTATDAMVEDTVEENNSQLVRVHFDEDLTTGDSPMVEYGSGPVQSNGGFQTPAPKAERKKSKDVSKKSDKKRKRLHVDTHDLSLVHVPREGDEIMADAPPVLHSGLTGGIKNMLSHPSVFPPSPDYSGGDAASPSSPLKRTKHSKHERRRPESTITNSLMAMISSKPKKKTKSSKDKTRRKEKSSKSSRKLLEYKPTEGENTNQVVLYKNPADTELFMSLVNKGPDSQRGCSVNKALKRYHRERTGMGIARAKGSEEKDLFRALRLKRNDRGEVVVFFEN